MTSTEKAYPLFSYDAHARKCAPSDLLGQVRRTVNGAPVQDEQIAMILAAIRDGLAPQPDDIVLEIACGNGSLSHMLFDSCAGYLGSDVSDYLISVAQSHFERMPNYRFVTKDGLTCLRDEPRPERFTKALCYAGFQYFQEEDAVEVLRLIAQRFKNISRVFIGNMPDREHVGKFYVNRAPSDEELGDCNTAIGVWRRRSDIQRIGGAAGWHVTLSMMPAAFQSAHYRFDAVFTRAV